MYPMTDAPVRRRSGGLRGHGLGIEPVTIATASIPIVKSIFGARERAGGADPCIATFLPGELVKNAGQGGAPPDYRSLPINLKDDAADCIPIPWGGRTWIIDPLQKVWIEATGVPGPGASFPPPPPPGAPPPPPPPAEGLDVAKLLPLAAGAFFLLRK